MNDFTYTKAASMEDALRAVSHGGDSSLIAGGTDLIPLMKSEILSPAVLVDIAGREELARIERHEDGLHIGALASLAGIAVNEEVSRSYRALAQACDLAATPQLRNMGTIGGNLLQQTRCWYYRGPYNCWMKGGDTCFARGGENELHSVFLTAPEQSPCVSAHPSDPAAALMAFGAKIKYRTLSGENEIPIDDLYALPQSSRRTYNTLPAGAIITEIILPAVPQETRSVYLKAMQRASWAFALAGVAICLNTQDGKVSQARVALSGVAPIPVRAMGAEEKLTGAPLGELDFEELADTITQSARPLSNNRYKIPLLRGLYKQALEALAKG